jgi:transposase-like protein
MPRIRHTPDFREQALSKARQRGSRTLDEVATELNMSVGTLKGWLKTVPKFHGQTVMPSSLPQGLPAGQWSAVERLLALHESHGLSGIALNAWCREKGLFEHQLTAWREAFCATPDPQPVRSAQEMRESKAELKTLQGKHEVLQRELRRKERALAEAAALLVLQKKFQALLGDED